MLNLLANIAQCLVVVSSPLMDCGGLYFRRDVRIHKRTHFSYLYIYLSMFGWLKKEPRNRKRCTGGHQRVARTSSRNCSAFVIHLFFIHRLQKNSLTPFSFKELLSEFAFDAILGQNL